MSEQDGRDQRADRAAQGRVGSDEELARLLAEAGEPFEIPAEDLDRIDSAARSAWRMTVHRRRRERSEHGAGAVVETVEAETVEAESARAPAEMRTGRPARLRWAALAAGIAAAVLVGWWWLSSPGPVGGGGELARVAMVTGTVLVTPPDGTVRPLAAGEAVAAGSLVTVADHGPDGEPARLALRLADGGAVRLDGGTRLRLAAADAVELEAGAVYLDSHPGTAAARPGGGLTVTTPLGTAQEIGTQFSVRLLPPPAAAMELRVREGEVALAGQGRSDRAVAGEELVLSAGGELDRRAIPPHGAAWRWALEAAPAFPIEGSTLAEFLAWVERETGWRLRYADPAIVAAAEEIVLHGDLGDLAPDQAPFAVLPGAGLDGELADGELLIRRAR